MKIYKNTLLSPIPITWEIDDTILHFICAPFENDNEMSFYLAKHSLVLKRDLEKNEVNTIMFETKDMNEKITKKAIEEFVKNKTYNPTTNTRILFRLFYKEKKEENFKEAEEQKNYSNAISHKISFSLPIPICEIDSIEKEKHS